MVGADEHRSADFLDGIDRIAEAFIHHLNRLDGRLLHAGVADHIRIGKIADDHIILAAPDRLHQMIAHLISTHLRLEIVGRDILRRIHQNAVLILVGLLLPAVEEERHMRVLLCLSQTELGVPVIGKPLSEGIGDLHFLERDFLVRDRFVIVLEADILHIKPLSSRASRKTVKLVKIIVAEAVRDLACPVRTEIKEDDAVAVLDRGNRRAVFLQNHRGLYELIGFILLIGLHDRLVGGMSRDALPLGERVIRICDTVIVVVAVHRIIPSADHRDFADADLLHLVLKGRDIVHAALRRRVTAVQEAVHIYVGQPLLLRHLQQRIQMCDVAVHAAVRQQAVQMQISACLLHVLHGVKKLGILEEIPILNLLGDAGEILVNDAPGAHIHMADLGVSHLSVRKTDRKSARISLDERILLLQPVHHRRICLCHGIMKRIIRKSIPVKDQKYNWSMFEIHKNPPFRNNPVRFPQIRRYCTTNKQPRQPGKTALCV